MTLIFFVQRDCHIFLNEILTLDDNDSTQQQDLQITLRETLTLDDNDSTQQQDLQITLRETLTLDDKRFYSTTRLANHSTRNINPR